MRSLTARQELVVAHVYEQFGWSLLRLARVTGVGRRAIENALRRQGVIFRKTAIPHRASPMTDAAVRDWFAAAARPEQADEVGEPPAPLTRTITLGTELVLTYSRRRCQRCEQVTEHAPRCPYCGEWLDPPPRTQRDVDVQTLYDEQTRGLPPRS